MARAPRQENGGALSGPRAASRPRRRALGALRAAARSARVPRRLARAARRRLLPPRASDDLPHDARDPRRDAPGRSDHAVRAAERQEAARSGRRHGVPGRDRGLRRHRRERGAPRADRARQGREAPPRRGRGRDRGVRLRGPGLGRRAPRLRRVARIRRVEGPEPHHLPEPARRDAGHLRLRRSDHEPRRRAHRHPDGLPRPRPDHRRAPGRGTDRDRRASQHGQDGVRAEHRAERRGGARQEGGGVLARDDHALADHPPALVGGGDRLLEPAEGLPAHD